MCPVKTIFQFGRAIYYTAEINKRKCIVLDIELRMDRFSTSLAKSGHRSKLKSGSINTNAACRDCACISTFVTVQGFMFCSIILLF